MSSGDATPEELKAYLHDCFSKYEQIYEIKVSQETSLAVRFQNIIETACQKTGQQVAILIDEYDAPLQHSWKTPQHTPCTNIYKAVFAILKSQDLHEKFVFITGITKFTQISLFSVLNNLSNISFEPEYAAICGITKDEVVENFKPEIEKLGAYEGWDFDESVAQLKAYYDGYHFSRKNMVDVFNPFSLIKAKQYTEPFKSSKKKVIALAVELDDIITKRLHQETWEERMIHEKKWLFAIS